MRMTKRFAMLCTAALAVGLALPAQAQDNYPSKPITMLVGFAAGGGTDILARKAAEELQKELGQPVVVVNRPGGGSIIAWKELVATEPDGYTITMFLPVNGFIQKYLDSSESWIDPLTDIRMLGIINEDPWGIATGADAPYDDAKAFTEWTQSNPGARVSDGGPATAYHWGWQAFASETGADIRAITYRGATAEGLKAAASGEVAAAAAGAPEAASLMEAGHVKMLGIAADERLAAYPDVSTFKEQGIDFAFGITRGFAVPAGTPDEVVDKLAGAIQTVYNSERVQTFLEQSGFGALYLNAAESTTFLEEQDARFRELMRSAGTLRSDFQ